RHNALAQGEQSPERTEAERERAARAKERAARAEAEAVAETMGKLQAVTDSALRPLTLTDLLREVLQRVRDTMHVDAAGILLMGEHEGGEAFASGAVVTPEGRD